MKTKDYLPILERTFLVVMFILAAMGARADGYITEVAAIGLQNGKGNTIKSKYRGEGWTVLDKDLNDNAGGWDIYLAYKTSTTANPQCDYITDICVSAKKMSSFRFEGRTYYRAHSNSEFNGDLNCDAGGAYIYLYYTRDRVNLKSYGGTKRVLTELSTTSMDDDGYPSTAVVIWRECSYSGACDVNRDAGGDYIYIQQHYTTQTLSLNDHPTFYSDLIYTGKELNLLENGSSDYGTMMYKVDNGDWVTQPKATTVGDHTVEYYLNGGTYADNSSSSTKTVTINPPVVKANSLTGVFSQSNKTVTLTWSAGSLPGSYTDYSWVVYRGDTKIATLNHDVRSYTDTKFENENEETLYSVYYVSDFWEKDTKRDDAKATVMVNTTRTVPVNNLKADCQDDRIVFTWTSDGYAAGFGNKFNIYVGDETQPICTITPTDYQTSFQWEHRSTDQHTDRKNGTDAETGVPYTEEPLNACAPLNYRVEGVIGDKMLNKAVIERKAIGNGTQFYSFDATKGVHPGTVKLSWHVNLQGSEIAKTYIVERRMAERDNETWEMLHRMSSNEDYLFFTDETPLPGIYYDYRITVQDKCGDGTIITNEIADIGYAQTTGTVSGRITYGSTGTAVMGADVVMRMNSSSGETLEQFHSMHFTDTNGSVTWKYPSETYTTEKFATDDFTMQLWVFPEQHSNSWFARFGENMALGMSDTGQLCFKNGTGTLAFDGLTLEEDKYSHVTLTRNGDILTCYLLYNDADGNTVMKKATQELSGSLSATDATQFELGHFKGFADEFRLWTKCLNEDDVMENYDHLLVGNENNLETYWTFDEGLRTQFFDYSRNGSTYHQHHGRVGSNVVAATVTPEALALKAKTDKDGNYIIQGIPFTGEGTTYAIVPTMGIHEFNPTQALRYISNISLVHNSVDFDDVSSFPVRGVVYYEHTTIPVKDAYLYVDGIIAAKDGESVKTNDNGEFEVSVPIGDHFISVKINGHEFLNGGRYPADPNGLGLRHTFDREMSGLTFYDQTTVTVAGRVAGGELEYQKPLGLGQGKSNIGKAVLRLQLSNENGYLNVADQDPGSTVTSYDISDTDRVFQTQYGQAFVPGGKNYITVETDPETGEWVAQLPPLRYDVTSVVIPSRPESDAITSQDFSLPVIDATHPGVFYTDSVEVDGSWEKFNYEASAKMEYKAVSTLDVIENTDGTFGMKNYTVEDINGNEHEVPLYVTDADGNMVPDADGKVQYTFGYPVYDELSSYKYKIHAYERYTNYDSGTAVVDEVPLGGKVLTIKNQYASSTGVVQESGEIAEIVDDKIELDSLGKATYKFTAGFPNIQAPYTRGLSISYDNDGTEMGWSGNGTFRVIVLGVLPTGNNFVTAGPDKVLMVLRDPPGSHSKTTWREGTTTTVASTSSVDWKNDVGGRVILHFGVDVGEGALGPGIIHLGNLQNKVDVTTGADYLENHSSSNTTVNSVTAMRDISTSDSPNFVGAFGDVFIGTSTNIIFGACRQVYIKWNNVTNQPEVVQEDALAMGEEFSTFFNYTQFYIKETLIPNFKTIRNSLLTQVSDVNSVSRPAKGADPIYVTSLSEDDPRFGSSNNDKTVWGDKAVEFSVVNGVCSGPSYTILLPMDYNEDYQDMVNYYNEQVRGWEAELAANEQSKVEAIEHRNDWLKDNHSFSSGTSFTEEVTTTNTHTSKSSTSRGLNFVFSVESGYLWSGFGLSGVVHENFNKMWTSGDEDTKIENATMNYTLTEGGDAYLDYLSVDVFNAPDDFGPIFSTRAGATSCPYEDEDVTQYYRPGTVISAKTVQIEKPEIEVQVQQVTGIPARGTGTIKVNLRNNSDTGNPVAYNLLVTPSSNPDGLSVMMDDASLNRGTSVYVMPGETMVKTLTVRQTNPDILNYENVTLRLASQCNGDPQAPRGDVASHATFSVYFQPTCSDIKLESSHTLVNTDTETPVTLSMSGYNYSMATLKGLRLQYKAEDDADFRTLQEYTKDAARLAADPNLKELIPLEGTSKLNYVIDLRSGDYADKTYIFRAITVCDQGGNEVNNESEEITIVRDMTRPMLIATPSPANGILTSADDLLITFNEDIQGSILTKPNNFDVVGVLNESEVAHDVALSLAGNSIAKTEATIDLSGKSFATSFWVNYSNDGTLLTHGTADNNFTIAIDGGKLVVRVADATVTSTEALPVDKWLYLNVSYNAENNTVNAGYAMDASTVQLITGAKTKTYEGNGPVSLGGNGLSAKLQELSFWNISRSMAEAQSTMYTTKNRYTEGLMGYWQFNEGHGTAATDCARSRHMTLPSQNAWWIDGDNYALTLDGTITATADIASLNTTDSEDYLLEMWFRADKTNTATASIMSTPKMDLRLNAQGQMEMELAEGDVASVSTKNLVDGQWHHLAVNVLKSTNGNGIIYLDGEPCKQIAGSAMPTLFGDRLMLGGRRLQPSQGVYNFTQQLQGAIDEVRIWKGRRTADVIKSCIYSRVKGDEAGLVAYYPFEKSTRDAYNQIVTTATLDDAVAITGDDTPPSITLYAADGSALISSTNPLANSSTPPLTQAPKMENVQFNFVASERQIKVNLDEQPAKIEGCTLYITAKHVKDIHGNDAQPITWSVFVQQNKLRWQEADVAVTKTNAEAAQFTDTIENLGSESELWSLSGLPAWLTVNVDGGSLMPLTSTKLTFTIDSSLPIGTYETTLTLTGSQNIPTPLNITVVNEGDAPLWEVVPGESTMTIVGVLTIDGIQSCDSRDIIGAFRGSECVGVAQPKYFSRYDSYFVTIDIQGSSDDAGQPIQFQAYDASTGITHPIVTATIDNSITPITFEEGALLGRYANPVVFNVTDLMQQQIALTQGWNWISFGLTADQMDLDALMPNTDDNLTIIKSRDAGYAIYDGNQWIGRLTAIDNAQMYMVQANMPATIALTGRPVDPSANAIHLSSGWNWTPYTPTYTMSVADALAAWEPAVDDIIKSQHAVAYYDGYEWIGSLRTLEPGKGYMTLSAEDLTFNYPAQSATGPSRAPLREPSTLNPQPSTLNSKYASNMVLLAQVTRQGLPLPDVEVAILSGNECRTLAVTDSQGKIYVTVPGDTPCQLTVNVNDGHNTYILPQHIEYANDAVVGTTRAPYHINLDTATGIDSMDGQYAGETWYDIAGRKLNKAPRQEGIYIVNGTKRTVNKNK